MGSNTAEVIIIGSGIVGNSTAYYLAKRGMSVIVLEAADFVGHGASSRNGGGVRQSGRDPRELPLVMYGIKNIWPYLKEELGVDCQYLQGGNLRLGKNDEHKKILQGLTDKAVACGLDVKMIDGYEVRQINPYLSDEVYCGSWCPTDGRANPLVTTLAYYKAARDRGARFITGERVVDLIKQKGRLSCVKTAAGNTYYGDTIVIANQLSARDLVRTVGIDLMFHRWHCEALITEVEPHMFDQVLGTAEGDFYGHQTSHGSFVFGGSNGFEGYMNDDGSWKTFTSMATCTTRGILNYIPRLKDVKIVRTWAGEMDDCVDHIPVLGNCEEVPGMVLATGFSGHGFGIGPAVGDQIAELIATGKTTIDLYEYRYNRFKTKF